MKYVLGVDLGTGSAKAVAFNSEMKQLAVSQSFYPLNSETNCISEQDPQLIWKGFVNCLQEMRVTLGSAPMAVCLSAAMHSIMAVDASCSPITSLITWADSRSHEVASVLRSSSTGRQLYEATGMPLHPMSPLCKIIWMKENQLEIFQKAHKFVSAKEFIWFKLFGHYEIDFSIASATGLFDIHQLSWNTLALELAEISADRLSKPVNTEFRRTGVVDAELFEHFSETIFVIGASDGCLANVGSFSLEADTAALTIGTSGAVRIASKAPIIDFNSMIFSYFLDSSTFICGGPINNGGIVLQWLLANLSEKELNEENIEDLFKRVDQVSPGSEGLIFLPYLTGERAPIWDSASCGNFFGVKLHHKQVHFSRAALEGVCYAIYDVLNCIESHRKIEKVNLSGGFIASELWMQMLADVTGKQLCVLQTEDASAKGAAYWALKSVGADKFSFQPPANYRTIEPDVRRHELYADRFLIYKQLYQDLRRTMLLSAFKT